MDTDTDDQNTIQVLNEHEQLRENNILRNQAFLRDNLGIDTSLPTYYSYK